MAEATVVGRAQDGDLAAFELLVRRYQQPLYRLGYQLLRDRAEAQDVVQECLLQVWQKLPSLRDPGAFRGWAYQLATRRCMDRLRRAARRRTDVTADQDLQGLTDSAPSQPSARAEHAASLRALEAQLRALPVEQRVCWVLRELHGLSYAEIATATAVPVSTVRGRVARARENLMKGMEAWR